MVSTTVGRHGLASLVALTLVTALANGLGAHEVPNDVTIQAYLKPEGQRLRLLVRVPLLSMRDMTWPFRSPDILDLGRAASELTNAATLWVGDEATMYEGGRALPSPRVAAIRATPPTDRSFESYDQALELVSGPPPADTDEISVKEGFLDVLFEYPIESAASRFSINSRWSRLGIRTLMLIRLVLPDGGVRTFQLHRDPGLLHLDPAWYHAAWQFVRMGFAHPFDRTNDLLFLLCLAIPLRRVRNAVVVVLAFTLAYSLTLLASTFGFMPESLWFPPLIDTLMAVSLVYVAVENLASATSHHRWRTAFACGLVYGVGFSFALKQTLQFAGAHVMTSLLSFDAGIELGLTLVLALMIPGLALLFRFVVTERLGTAILSALAAHAGWHSMVERVGLLRQYQFTRPELTPAFFAELVRWVMAAVAVAGLLWLVSTIVKSRSLTSQVADPKSKS